MEYLNDTCDPLLRICAYWGVHVVLVQNYQLIGQKCH